MTRSIARPPASFRHLAALLLLMFCVRTAAGQSAAEDTVAVSSPGPEESAKPEQLLAAADDVKANGPGLKEAPAGSPKPTPPSEAEQITSLQKAIESDSKRADELRRDLVDPNSEYRKAEAAFKESDEVLGKAKLALDKLMEAGPGEEVTAAQANLKELERTWELARERFNLVLESRKTGQEQIAALEEKIRKNNGALQKLLGTVPEPEAAPASSSAGQESAPVTVVPAASPSQMPAPKSPAAAEPVSPPPAATPAPATAVSPSEAGVKVAEAPPAVPKAATKELIEAQTQVDQKEVEAVVAKEAAKSVAERIAALDKDISLENKLLVAARKKSDLAFQTRGQLDREHERLVTEGAAPHEIRALHPRRRETEEQFSKARLEVSERTDRLNDLQSQLAALQREALAAATTVEQKQQEVDEARNQVAKLQNPFSPHNVLQWLLDHGPRISIILLAILILRLSARLSSRRITSLISQRGSRGTLQEREDRARTLVGVFRNAFSITTTVGGTLMICEEVGIAVGPLMGGAAVLGLAVAFGAQNLIRDYFYGFVILIENQYKLNDVLKIGNVSGQVEQITLRMTVLRDQEGNVHFVPNGKIDSVTNMSHGWSRALIEVSVAYKENVDRCMQVLMDLAEELQNDSNYSNSFLDRPEMLGVDSLGESAVQIRFLIKTRPLHQWRVKREMLRRIKRRFDELGIEIPCPQLALRQRDGAVGAVRDKDSDQRAA